MRATTVKTGALTLVILGSMACVGLAQPGFGERVAEKVQGVGRGLKRGVQDVSGAVRKRFEIVRADVGRMETHSRVYSRLHWDSMLHNSSIEVHMLRDGTALLKGTVPDEAARAHAVELTKNTVGITSVIDDLTPLVTTQAAKTSKTIRTRE
ncbi:BON domain-containing protein [Singulisphaera rosea]